MNNTEKLFNDLVNNDEQAAMSSFTVAIQDKLDQVMAVRRVAITSEVFNQATVEESTELEEAAIEITFKKGKSSKKEIAKFKNQKEFEKWFIKHEDDIEITSHKGLEE